MVQQSFFSSQSPRSALKTDIVTKYFKAWAAIISPRSPLLAYVDLFAGSGAYEDGIESTPLRILRIALNDKSLCRKLITVFNDADTEAINALQNSVSKLEGVTALSYPPRFLNVELGKDLAGSIGVGLAVPTLSFIDPFGYLGVTQSLIEGALKGWGSECLLFFNYNQINRAINNVGVKTHMDALFTPQVAEELRVLTRKSATPAERESAILNGLTKSLNSSGSRHLLFFRFKALDKNRTSHYIVHLSGHKRGYFIMRDVMAGSSSMRNGIPLFEWSPEVAQQLNLDLGIEGDVGMSELKRRLVEELGGRLVQVKECYEKITYGTPYLRKHFTKAVDELEIEGKVAVSKPREQRLRNGQVTLGNDLSLKFS